MVLDWCVRIAKGEPVWGLPTQKGTTLYLCLEDTLRRVQDRLNRITEEVPGNAYFSAQAETMAGGLLDEIRRFVGQHPGHRAGGGGHLRRGACPWRGTRPTAATIRRCAS